MKEPIKILNNWSALLQVHITVTLRITEIRTEKNLMKDTCHLIIRVTLIPVVVLNCFTLFKVYTVDANEMENQRFLKKKNT